MLQLLKKGRKTRDTYSFVLPGLGKIVCWKLVLRVMITSTKIHLHKVLLATPLLRLANGELNSFHLS